MSDEPNESTDVAPDSLASAAVLATLALAALGAGVRVEFNLLRSRLVARTAEERIRQDSLLRQGLQPPLQIDEPGDLARGQAAQRALLETPGPSLDGSSRISIEQAMRILSHE